MIDNKKHLGALKEKLQYVYEVTFFSFLFRVLPDLTIADLRSDISAQLETEVVPRHFVFVRGVGRHFTEVSFVCM